MCFLSLSAYPSESSCDCQLITQWKPLTAAGGLLGRRYGGALIFDLGDGLPSSMT